MKIWDSVYISAFEMSSIQIPPVHYRAKNVINSNLKKLTTICNWILAVRTCWVGGTIAGTAAWTGAACEPAPFTIAIPVEEGGGGASLLSAPLKLPPPKLCLLPAALRSLLCLRSASLSSMTCWKCAASFSSAKLRPTWPSSASNVWKYGLGVLYLKHGHYKV